MSISSYICITVYLFLNYALKSGVHMQNMQVCYIGIHMPWRFPASITLSSISGISPHVIPPLPPHPPLSLPYPPRPAPCVRCSPPWVHMFSLFNTHLWVRTCGIWFYVLVSVCWEWWFQIHPSPCKGHKLIVFYGCVVFHGVYVPRFLCPVYHWWASGLILRKSNISFFFETEFPVNTQKQVIQFPSGCAGLHVFLDSES